jgi:hypothetical protein
MEFKIALTEMPMSIALVYRNTSRIWWPAALADDCQAKMLTDQPISEEAIFLPGSWIIFPEL